MTGSVVNLAGSGIIVPDPIVVDTNVIAEYLLASYFVPSQLTQWAQQSFLYLTANQSTGIVTPTAFTELIHVAIRVKYRQEVGHMSPHDRSTRYRFPIRSWQDLYKQDKTILQSFQSDLQNLRALCVANGLLFIGPEDFGPVPSGRSHDDEVVRFVGTYGLDSNDAAILLEAQRCGVTDIVSFDADLRQANSDFTIYTWI